MRDQKINPPCRKKHPGSGVSHDTQAKFGGLMKSTAPRQFMC